MKITSQDLMTKLSAAVSFYYKDDAMAPSIVTSTLQDGQIYMSVVRYYNKFSLSKTWTEGKSVVCRVTAPSIPEATVLLSKRFVEYTTEAKPPTDPLEVLKKAIIYR